MLPKPLSDKVTANIDFTNEAVVQCDNTCQAPVVKIIL